MSDRIKSLEDALGALHQEHSRCRLCTCQSQTTQKRNQPEEPHPLLRGELLLIKGQLELYGLNPLREQAASPREQGSQVDASMSPRDIAESAQVNGYRKEAADSETDRGEEVNAAMEARHNVAVNGEPGENGRADRRVAKKSQSQNNESPAERGKRLRAMLPPRDEAEHLVREAVWCVSFSYYSSCCSLIR